MSEDGLGGRRRAPVRVEREFTGFIDPPAGEGAGGLADVLLAVVADAQAEQLHQLACVVLIGLPLGVTAGIEPDHHGRRRG